MTNTQDLKWQLNSIPKDKNYEVIECSSCGNQSAVHKKDHAIDFTCGSCYSK